MDSIRTMVYDGGVMRSILALFLALLILAAEAPGLFTESPVCAAVDGRGPATPPARAPAKSCCGMASCPMHATGCRTEAACPMADTKTTPAAAVQPETGTSDVRLCAPSCGREGARMVPGVPDPGTLDPTPARATILTAAGPIEFALVEPATRNPASVDPPPRA